ncbi:MAG: exosortase C-terminal domain/associated protein EpsI [Planctomycetota bacterium]|jgi:EpsI family protein
MKRAIPIIAVLLLAVAGWQVYTIRGRLAAGDADPAQLALLKSNLEHLPLEVGDGAYQGKPHEVDLQVIRDAGADAYGSVQFLDDEGNRYRLYVGGAVANAENFHAPSYCLPSSGWEVLEHTIEPLVGLPGVSADARMRRMTIQKGRERMVVYFWFQAGSRTTDDEFMVRIYRFMDLLLGAPFRPTMIVTVYVSADDDLVTADSRGRDFLSALGPHLMRALKGEDPIS